MPIDHLPRAWRPAAERLRCWLMSDATAMLILGLGVIARGVSYLPGVMGPPPARGSHPAEGILPMHIWAWVWIVAGVLCILAAFVRSQTGLGAAALGTGVGLNAMWAMSFLLSTILGDNPRGWVSSVGYFSICAFAVWSVWRGKRGDIRVKGGGA